MQKKLEVTDRRNIILQQHLHKSNYKEKTFTLKVKNFETLITVYLFSDAKPETLFHNYVKDFLKEKNTQNNISFSFGENQKNVILICSTKSKEKNVNANEILKQVLLQFFPMNVLNANQENIDKLRGNEFCSIALSSIEFKAVWKIFDK
jgi:hypothetical protein